MRSPSGLPRSTPGWTTGTPNTRWAGSGTGDTARKPEVEASGSTQHGKRPRDRLGSAQAEAAAVGGRQPTGHLRRDLATAAETRSATPPSTTVTADWIGTQPGVTERDTTFTHPTVEAVAARISEGASVATSTGSSPSSPRRSSRSPDDRSPAGRPPTCRPRAAVFGRSRQPQQPHPNRHDSRLSATAPPGRGQDLPSERSRPARRSRRAVGPAGGQDLHARRRPPVFRTLATMSSASPRPSSAHELATDAHIPSATIHRQLCMDRRLAFRTSAPCSSSTKLPWQASGSSTVIRPVIAAGGRCCRRPPQLPEITAGGGLQHSRPTPTSRSQN